MVSWKTLDLKLLRFTNEEIVNNVSEVSQKISETINQQKLTAKQ